MPSAGKLPLLAAWRFTRAHISSNSRLKPKITHRVAFVGSCLWFEPTVHGFRRLKVLTTCGEVTLAESRYDWGGYGTYPASQLHPACQVTREKTNLLKFISSVLSRQGVDEPVALKWFTEMLPKLILRHPYRGSLCFLPTVTVKIMAEVLVDTLNAIPAGPPRQCKSRHELEEHMLTGATFLHRIGWQPSL